MFFQVPNSPKDPQKKDKKQKAFVVEEAAILKLAPFTPNPKIFFENVFVGEDTTKLLIVQNPNAFNNKLTITKIPPGDRGVKLNWNETEVEANGEIVLEITWCPKEEGGWRDILSITDCRNVKRDIPIVFKSLPKKMKKRTKVKTTVGVKSIKSPVKKYSPKTLKKKRSPFKIPVEKLRSPKSKTTSNRYFDESNKENSFPCFSNAIENLNFSYNNKNSFSEKLNKLECSPLFRSPTSINFKCDNTTPLRRGTYYINSKPLDETPDEFNDSLECEKMIDSSNPQQTCDNILRKLTTNSFTFNSPSPFKFILNDTKTLDEIKNTFKPNDCSTEQKNPPLEKAEKNSSNPKELFKSNNTFVLDTSEMFNISGGTFTIENTSTTSTYSIISSFSEIDKPSNLNRIRTSSPVMLNTPFDCLNPNYMNFSGVNAKAALSCITEEEIASETFNKLITSTESIPQTSNISRNKRKPEPEETVFNISPPKRPFVKPKSPKNQTKTSWSKKYEKTERIRKKSISSLKLNLTKNMTIKTTTTTTTAITKEPCKIDPFLIAAMYDTTNNVTTDVDPFIASTLYYDESWLDKQINELKKWLNALLTPPSELETSAESKKIDVARIWQDCVKKELIYAPTKEKISLKYHTNHKLEHLRRKATEMFHSNEISCVMSKIAVTLENKMLTMREDKNLHLDVGLQTQIMTILLCYNPLWLRIGLETIYNEKIPLSSNSDVVGLSTFILLRFFHNPDFSKNHTVMHNKYLAGYAVRIKKFTLKKFLMLVYFLDYAKTHKLIAHDPCLFCRDAPIKESKEVLVSFAREVIAAIGDITKFLKRFGYEVTHKQSYIDEFNYAVKSLGVDLRDGIRLTKVMEIILLRDDLTCQLRGPAISRLQKMHNVRVAMESLKNANYTIAGDIEPKDIVDGHREKTLSLLWQIIYKFQAPRFTFAATKLQKWWRSLQIQIKLRILDKPRKQRIEAAIKIQRYYRGYIQMKRDRAKFLTVKKSVITLENYFKSVLLMKKERAKFLSIKQTCIAIQRKFRANKYINAVLRIQRKMKATLEMKKQREIFVQQKSAVIFIQRKFRAWIMMKQQRQQYLQLKLAVVNVQQKYLAKIAMRKARAHYLNIRNAVLKIQRKFRAYLLMRKVLFNYLITREAIIVVQQQFRANIQMKMCRENYLQLREATITIQQRFKANKAMKSERQNYLKLKHSACLIQKWFRANRAMKLHRAYYLTLQKTVIRIQQKFRATKLMKIQREQYLLQRKAITIIQNKWRAIFLMKQCHQEYLKMRKAAIILQQHYRANVKMKKEREGYLKIRKAVCILQQRFRANVAMKDIREKYLITRQSVIIIQERFRAYKTMKLIREQFIFQRNAVVLIQERFRATLLMRTVRNEYLAKLQAVRLIQNKFKAYLMMKQVRNNYIHQKEAVIKIQQWFKATVLMKSARNEYLVKLEAVRTIQTKFRAYLLMKQVRLNYLLKKEAAIIIQQRFRGKLVMETVRNKYLAKLEAVRIIQNKFRAHLLMKETRQYYLFKKQAVIIIQQRLRATLLMRTVRNEYLAKLEAVTIIQTKFRAHLLMKEVRKKYLHQKEAIIIIQQRFRATLLMRTAQNEYLAKQKAIRIIQNKFRAYLLMKEAQQNYLRKKKAALIIQQRVKATLLMRTVRGEYLAKQKTVRIIQAKLRAYLVMKEIREKYLHLRETVIRIQQRFRATLLMKFVREEYLAKREAVRIIQNKFRAHLKMREARQNYLIKKEAAVIIQQRFKAIILMRTVQKEYLTKLGAIRIIQSKFRAHLLMKQSRQHYLLKRKAAIIIQQRFRATILMRSARNEFVTRREAVRRIQIKYKAYLLMKETRQSYLNQKHIVINLQRTFRANHLMKQQRIIYLQQVQSIIKIQRWFRNIIISRKQRKQFLRMKDAATIIQKHFRNYLIMKNMRIQYLNYKLSVIKIQTYYRHYLTMRKERHEFLEKRRAVVKIQSWSRMILAKRLLAQLKEDSKDTEEKRIERRLNKAAVKIQAAWRGYKTRSVEDSNITLIRQKTKDATRKASPELTMGQRNLEAIEILIYQTSMKEILRALRILDFTTRLFPNACIEVVDQIVDQLYLLLANTNRSVPDMEAVGLCVSVLINLYKFVPTSKPVWKVEHIDTLLSLLLHWSDKEGVIFINLCTLIWLFAQNPENCKVILAAENASKLLLKTYQQCERKQKMLAKMKNSNNSINTSINNKYVKQTKLNDKDKSNSTKSIKIVNHIPSLKPDWGIFNINRPRTFQNPLFAIKCLLKKLNM